MIPPHRTASLSFQAACAAIPVLCVYGFLQDLIDTDWLAWVFTPLTVGVFGAIVLSCDKLKPACAVLRNLVLVLVPFMGLYSILDDVIMRPWLTVLIAALVALGGWALLWMATLVVDD
jgi:hypothetical protein